MIIPVVPGRIDRAYCSADSKDEAAEKDAEEVGHAAQDDGHQGDDRVAK